MKKPREEFSQKTKEDALERQKNKCASCGTQIFQLGEAGRAQHAYGESTHAHHIQFASPNTLNNCVILCEACHYSAHGGGNYKDDTIQGTPGDFLYING